MAASVLGRGAVVQVGKEVTWGVAATLTNSISVTSVTAPAKSVDLQRVNTLCTGSRGKNPPVKGMTSVGGSLTTPMAYSGTGLLLEAALGAVAESGVGPYVHTYTIGDTLPSLTTEFVRGTAATAEKVVGMKVNTFSLTIPNDGTPAGFTFDMVGKDSTRAAPTSAPQACSAIARDYVLLGQGGTLEFNSVTYKLLSLDLTVNNNLITDRQTIDSNTILEQQGQFVDISLAMTIEYSDDNPWDAMIAETVDDAVITLNGAGNNQIEITLQNAQVMVVDAPVSGEGRIIESITFE